MQSLGFRLFLFFLLADVALFAMLVMPEDYYTPTPAVIVSEAPPKATERGFISAAPSPNARQTAISADTTRPAIRYREPAK
ncbi:hypothetical protein [Rhodoflexus caldus]|uniref:hypothetical protein n=1 Tax=Rhodoflexus caldus TaxID=2891236 RepID=UPI002029F737|nr:hypothetical protein [Rhodoflexus caldus]